MDQIIACALPVWERLRNPPLRVHDPGLAAERIARWARIVSNGDPELLGRRLQWAGWQSGEVQRALGGIPTSGCSDLRWAATLAQIRASAGSLPSRNAVGLGTVPFEPLLLPLTAVALERLHSDGWLTLLSDQARQALQQNLLARLAEISAPAFYAEFARTLPKGPDVISVLIGPPRILSTRHYDEFIRKHLSDRYAALFRTYPVLARLLATTLDNWIAAVFEFVRRFAADRAQLQTARITHLQAGLSEPHNQGRSVIAFQDDTGRRFVYKPRSVDGEAAYHRLCTWCNRQNVPGWLPLLAPEVIDRDGYGWVEYIETQECRDAQEASRYFERIGELLCLLHALQSSDVNRENLLAQGENPVLIDAETLLQPDTPALNPSASAEPLISAPLEFGRSVARCGVLPAWESHPAADTAFDLAGLAGGERERSPVQTQCFYNVNTDSMVLVNEFGEIPVYPNVARLNGRALDPAQFTPQILAGFERAYRLLTDRRDEFAREALSPNPDLLPLRLRYVFRPTRLYYALLIAARSPEWLADGIAHSMQLDRISGTFLDSDGVPRGFGILGSELEALEHGEVPYFEITSDSADLESGEVCISGFFERTPKQQALDALSSFSEAGLEFQKAVIGGSLEAHRAHLTMGEPGLDYLEETPATREELLDAALAIAGEIRKTAAWIRGNRGRPAVFWMGPIQLDNSDRYNFLPVGEDLYYGRCGIALFLAAVARVTGSGEDGSLIEGALCYARDGWKDAGSGNRGLRTAGIGAVSGIGSIAYALFGIGRLLGRRDLVQAAVEWAVVLDPDSQRETQLDLVSGRAGAILVLLRLFEETRDSRLLSTAIRCGTDLLKHRGRTEAGPQAWPVRGKMLAGMAHGAAGIAYSLLRLYEFTGDERYLECAREGVEYEDLLFDTGANNWRDLRERKGSHAKRPAMASWCHGAPGIGLARLAGLASWDDARIRADIEAAISSTLGHPLNDVDHLCCGNFGRLEFLWSAAMRLQRPELGNSVLCRTKWILARAQANSGYRTTPGSIAPAPSLFRGVAGIGYELLRFLDLESVPSILLIA